MKKLITILFLTIIAFSTSCNSDDEIAVVNGFRVDGNFYETPFVKCRTSNAYELNFSNLLDYNLPESHFGSFYLNSGDRSGSLELIPGTYTTANGVNTYYSIDNQEIRFQKNSEEGSFAYSNNWSGDSEFSSGKVTINSITSTPLTSSSNNEFIISQIDIDYRFVMDGKTVTGNYSGSVDQFN
jgi:hypothetical protein